MIGSIITEVKESIDFSELGENNVSMPMIPMQDDVIFPMTPQTLEVTDETQIELLKKCVESHKPVFTAYVKKENQEETVKGIVGSVCKVLKMLELPNGRHTAFLLPGPDAKVLRITRKTKPMRVMVEINHETVDFADTELKALFESVKEVYLRIVNEFSDDPKELKTGLDSFTLPVMALSFMCSHSPLQLDDKQRILQAGTFRERCLLALRLLHEVYQLMKVKAEIQRTTHEELSRQQKEHFLRQQMQSIQNELGGTIEDAEEEELLKRAEEKKWPQYASEHFEKELKKLERFNMQNPEYSIQYNYLDTLLTLPWDNYSDDRFELDKVEEILDRDHYGLEKVKDRILEQVAVLKLRADMKAPIICLYGPPGVGKTSLGRSVAEALGREYCRVSLGGLHDEAEIRGHRRTYIGAMPGRIISAMKRLESWSDL